MGLETITAQALEQMNNDRYMLSIAVFKRIEDLTKGAKPLVNMDIKKCKYADIALHEIAQGLVKIDSIEEIE